MIANFSNYFTNLNNAGQALFIVGVLLVITFIILLIVVLKPEKNDVKKIYGESIETDEENIFEEKMKNIDDIDENDINIENDRTRNLKSIVDELKHVEPKNTMSIMEQIEKYEDEQEDTAIISVEELLKASKAMYPKEEKVVNKQVEDDDFDIIDEEDTKEIKIIGTLDEINKRKEENKYTPRREVFSSVYSEPKNS